jgi:hypothetical protein
VKKAIEKLELAYVKVFQISVRDTGSLVFQKDAMYLIDEIIKELLKKEAASEKRD